jgi:hypothetical protein
MKNNEIPKRSFFDIVLENTHKTKDKKDEKIPDPKPNPLFLLGLLASPLFFSIFIYLGLDVLSHKIVNFPSFSYFDSVKMYIGSWVIINLFKRK